MDPFRSIEAKYGGDISESQEKKLSATAFLGDDDYHNDDPNNSSATSAAVDGEDDSGQMSFFLSASPSNAPPPMRPADAAVQICTPPASLSTVDLSSLRLNDAAAVEIEKTTERSPLGAQIECSKDKSNENLPAVAVKEESNEIDQCSPLPSTAVTGRDSQPFSAGNKSRKKKLGARPRKLIGAKIAADNTSSAASTESSLLAKSAHASSNMPTSLSGQQSSPSNAGTSAMNSVANNLQGFPANLLEVIKAFSKKPNRRFADTDILEIAKMKGIEFPNPPWWRPGGYSDDDDD